MKNKAAKQKSKRKGSENVFGCDLTEHLQNSGQDVPQVLKTCGEFIEKHGIVDGIYRLSGITSNIQRLRQEFISELCPDLTKEVYLQDIHCVGSLCKLYFRELPNPLLTYELYKKFTDAVSVKGEHEQLQYIQGVIRELPVSHFRTLEYLSKHLAHLATLSHQTNMHARNLALVWAPNLLRSKDIELSSCNGDSAFLEVRVQQTVVEFILNHTDQIFDHGDETVKTKGPSLSCGEKYATLPAMTQCGPMKLMSLEEAQARSLCPDHPARRERPRENSLPDASTSTLYHTVIDLSDSKRKFSGKSKKWKSIFSLGRSVADSKGKLSRNGSVFMRAQNISEKPSIRPSKSMDSLCSLPTDDDKVDKFGTGGGANGFFVPQVKSRTLGSDLNYDLSETDPAWEVDLRRTVGASGGSPEKKKGGASTSSTSSLHKSLPEQLKVFKGDELGSCQPTSPKNRRMLYSSSAHNGSSRPSFPGSLFPLESSPRHQRKALNISEPFAVSVPLRVSAVISSNSTPCRQPDKDRAVAGAAKSSREAGPLEPERSASLAPSQGSSRSGSTGERDGDPGLGGSSGCISYKDNTLTDSSGGSGYSIYSNSSSVPLEKEEVREEKTSESEKARTVCTDGTDLQLPHLLQTMESGKERPPSPGKQLENQPAQNPESQTTAHLDLDSVGLMNDELKITEPDNILEDLLKPDNVLKKLPGSDIRLQPGARAKRRSSLPSHALLPKSLSALPVKPLISTNPVPERQLSFERGWIFGEYSDVTNDGKNKDENRKVLASSIQLSPLIHMKETDILQDIDPWPVLAPCSEPREILVDQQTRTEQPGNAVSDVTTHANGLGDASRRTDEKDKRPSEQEKEGGGDVGKRNPDTKLIENVKRVSKCMEERRLTLELPHQDEEDSGGGHLGGLDQVEPWEDFSSTKQWVTSPLHSPKIEDLFQKDASNSVNAVSESVPNVPSATSPSPDSITPGTGMSPGPKPTQPFAGCICQSSGHKSETKLEVLQPPCSTASSVQDEATKLPRRNSCNQKTKNTAALQRFHRQASHEPHHNERREEKIGSRHRPYSLNLDLGQRCIRDISNQQNLDTQEPSSLHRGSATPSGSNLSGLSLELEMFLGDRQAPVRRNSAPVSVSSVRTAFMIKTCQAKAVPVIPPKIQYSQIPHPVQEQGREQKKGPEKEKPGPLPLSQPAKDSKDELENREPASRMIRSGSSSDKSLETCKALPIASELPVLRRKRSSNGETSVEGPRPERPSLLQRSSFRNRPRPQSLIIFSPPFPSMDYASAGDDGRLLLSPIKSPTETSALEVFTKGLVDNIKTPEGVTLRNKMTLPKSGQRLETSTSCFYQPQRRSMIFDNRSNRQIE
ncbi:rho GTPase-activating protein 31 [Denticeps clupeoides]|uniref:Rho-GAP domain-containing protein n=1 Tax=Denticeps clupeoides TaxID=299321 RepID=A0AAY4BL97_9TELE|nr:rho GTPase-activating protein 31-like [Denticeps clupeoides]